MSEDILKALLDEGVSPGLIAKVADRLFRAEAALATVKAAEEKAEAKAEERREKARLKKARQRSLSRSVPGDTGGQRGTHGDTPPPPGGPPSPSPHPNPNPPYNPPLPEKNTPVGVSKDAAPSARPRTPKGDPRVGTRLPADFGMADEWRAYAVAQGIPAGEVTRTFERFRNYWAAKTGRDATKLDWLATWRNWVIADCQKHGWAPTEVNPASRGPPKPPRPGMRTHEEILASIRWSDDEGGSSEGNGQDSGGGLLSGRPLAH